MTSLLPTTAVLARVPGAQRDPLDWGRTVMVPTSVLLGVLAFGKVLGLLQDTESRTSAVGVTAAGILSGLFSFLMVWAYLRRSPARATSRAVLALVAAPVATFLPFTFPLVAAGGASTTTLLVGDLLLVAGLLWAVWSIGCLDRSLSVLPQARALVDHGPYRHVRHPLYLGEVVAMLGSALALGGPLPLVAWGALVVLQCCRATQEEALLSTALSGYQEYRSRTSRVLPGLF